LGFGGGKGGTWRKNKGGKGGGLRVCLRRGGGRLGRKREIICNECASLTVGVKVKSV